VNKVITQAISALLATGLGSASLAAQSEMQALPGMEKCYGIAKAHQNDCSTAQNTCAGEVATDASPHAWVQVPTGLCQKIVGGNLKKPAQS
jgi:uncharacterized membrane protein